jgi:hypothetical protein
MQITLDEIREHLEQYHSYDGYGMAICPFHQSFPIRPSLMVWESGFKCKSCGEHGSLIKLNNLIGNVIITQKYYYNPSQRIWSKWLNRFGNVQTIATIAEQQLKNEPNLDFYLRKRKIESQIKKGRFGYLDGYYTFPILNQYDEIMGLVARASPSIQTDNLRYTVSPKCPQKLYVPDWEAIKKEEYLFSCYGTLDAWSLYMAGYASFTGISGQELNAENIPFRKPMFIIPDRLEEKNAIMLRHNMGWRMEVLLLNYPEDCKDINDIHMKYGIDKLKELIKEKLHA